MRKDLEGRLNLMAGKIAHAAGKDAKRKAQLGEACLADWYCTKQYSSGSLHKNGPYKGPTFLGYSLGRACGATCPTKICISCVLRLCAV